MYLCQKLGNLVVLSLTVYLFTRNDQETPSSPTRSSVTSVTSRMVTDPSDVSFIESETEPEELSAGEFFKIVRDAQKSMPG